MNAMADGVDSGAWSVRRATADDIPLIHEMAWQVFPETYKDILSKEQSDYMMDWMYSEENIRKQMEDDGHTYLLGFMGGVPAGYVSYQSEGENLYHLQKIYVLPTFQGRSLGRKLFEAVESAIREEHPSPCSMELNVNRHNKALGFYEHMGMNKVREGDFPIGGGYFMNDYIMSIDL